MDSRTTLAILINDPWAYTRGFLQSLLQSGPYSLDETIEQLEYLIKDLAAIKAGRSNNASSH